MHIRKTLNGNTVCAIGLNTTKEEISEVCILPLNTALDPMYEKCLSFNPFMKDEAPLRTRRVILRSNIDAWYEKLDFWFEENIANGQIIPLVYDWPFSYTLLAKLLGGSAAVDYFFLNQAKDIKTIALFLTDLAEWTDVRPLPFPKCTLRYITNNSQASMPEDATALDKAKALAKAYKTMLSINPQGLSLSL